MGVQQCQHMTKKNLQCRKRTQEKYCYIHKRTYEKNSKIYKDGYVNLESSELANNDTNALCPICLESDKVLHKLNCGHYIHITCCEGMYKLECPMCRAEITNISDECKNKILKNIENDKDEEQEFSTSSLMNLIFRYIQEGSLGDLRDLDGDILVHISMLSDYEIESDYG